MSDHYFVGLKVRPGYAIMSAGRSETAACEVCKAPTVITEGIIEERKKRPGSMVCQFCVDLKLFGEADRKIILEMRDEAPAERSTSASGE